MVPVFGRMGPYYNRSLEGTITLTTYHIITNRIPLGSLSIVFDCIENKVLQSLKICIYVRWTPHPVIVIIRDTRE